VRQETARIQCGSFFLNVDRAAVAKMQELLGSKLRDELLNEARWFLWVHHFLAFHGQAVLFPFWDLVFVKEDRRAIG